MIYKIMAKKTLKNFYIDNELSMELDRKKLEDQKFNRSELINKLLQSYLSLDVADSQEEINILNAMDEVKSSMIDNNNRLMSLSVKLTQIRELKKIESEADNMILERKKEIIKRTMSEVLK